jgi:hypothetical protein
MSGKDRVIAAVGANYALGSVVAFSGKGKTLKVESADDHALHAVEMIMRRAGATSISYEPRFVIARFA